MPGPEMVLVGSLAGAFGVRGETRIKSYCADPAAIADYVPLTTADGRTFHQVILTGQAKGALIARLDGILTKEDADALKGTDLYVPRSVLPSLPDDEFYHADLIGLEVLDTAGRPIGTVKAVQDHGAGDLLELHVPGASATVLVPFTKAAVPTVDLAAGRIIADPPPGLLPEPE